MSASGYFLFLNESRTEPTLLFRKKGWGTVFERKSFEDGIRAGNDGIERKNMEGMVTGIGEVLWDIFPDRKIPGGAPANFAWHVSQLGLKATAVSAVGADAWGDELVQAFIGKGIDAVLQRTDFPTGTVEVTLDAEGIPRYEIKRNVAWDHIAFTEELERLAVHTRLVAFGTLAQRNPESRHTVLRFLDGMPADALRVLDINLRQEFYTSDIVKESLTHCDMLKINEEELVCVSQMLGCRQLDLEKVSREILGGYGLRVLILTCGTDGSYVFTPDRTSFLDTPKVEVVDTVGAGDAFTAAFCAALLKNRSVQEAHRLAVDVAAYVCTQPGAMPVMPSALADPRRQEGGSIGVSGVF